MASCRHTHASVAARPTVPSRPRPIMPTQNTDQFLQRFAAQVPDLRGKRICVGLSGGADSVVLLHVLAALRDSFGLADLSAVHVHHGLNAAADDWQQFCRDYAQRLGVGFSAARVQVEAGKLGIEAAARTARYAVFAEQNADFVALAHHRDDQIETFFLAALRGGGLRALSAMPEQRALTEKTVLWRPLLAFSRAEIEQYAQDNALVFVHDDSNENPAFLRNWLRGRWLPDLAARLPHYAEHLHSSIALLQEERALLEEVAAQDWQAVRCAQGLHQARWQAFSPARQRQLLHTFARQYGLGAPTAGSLHLWADWLRQAERGEWRLPRGRAVLSHGVLFAVPQDFALLWLWVAQPVQGSLHLAAQQAGLAWQGSAPQGAGCFRAARRDDKLPTNIGRKNVFRLLQEKRVPAFVRPFWAVACDENGRCIAVANLRSAPELGQARLIAPDLLPYLPQAA